jgi:hypothetical protein
MLAMHQFLKYLSHFDGSKKWEEIEPVVEETFHKDLIVLDGSNKYDRAEFIQKLKEFVEAGGWMEILKIKVAPHHQGIQYEINFHHPKSVASPVKNLTKSLGQFSQENGKLFRITRDQVRRAHPIL